MGKVGDSDEMVAKKILKVLFNWNKLAELDL